MGLIRRWMWLPAFLVVWPLGCSQTTNRTVSHNSLQTVRVRLMQDVDHANVAAEATRVHTDSNPADQVINFPRGIAIPVTLTAGGWHIHNISLGTGVLTIRPMTDGSLSIDHRTYRGSFRFVPVAPDKFDVVNDVDIEGYLKGVLPMELYATWHDETYKAQAIVARTYALYEARTSGAGRYWDLNPDQRSQVYGGVDAETAKSRQAVDATEGVVLTYGDGDGKIFKAYFSSCCGGVTQAAADAFPTDAWSEPLSDHDNRARCNASPSFNWGPVAITKTELTRRFRAWGERKAKQEGHPRAEAAMAPVYTMAVQSVNRYGRPTRFIVVDAKGVQYSWASEEMRSAVNTDAPKGAPTLKSSFCKVNAFPASPVVTFYDGHGLGHGVGMCQWCAEAEAADGASAEQIVLDAFPHAKLRRAY